MRQGREVGSLAACDRKVLQVGLGSALCSRALCSLLTPPYPRGCPCGATETAELGARPRTSLCDEPWPHPMSCPKGPVLARPEPQAWLQGGRPAAHLK